jgi:AcrR family transcriptional regulator
MARTQSKNYPEVRESILKSAAKLFADKGYPNTTILDLANACNSSRGALYHYFDSKEQILIEILKTHLETVLMELRSIVALEHEPMPAFLALMRRLMRMNSENQVEQITLLNEMNQLDPQTRAQFTQTQKQIVDLVTEALSRLDDFGRMTPENRKVYGMMLLGALNYTYIWYDPAGAITPETYADMTVDAFIAGFGRPALDAAAPLAPATAKARLGTVARTDP